MRVPRAAVGVDLAAFALVALIFSNATSVVVFILIFPQTNAAYVRMDSYVIKLPVSSPAVSYNSSLQVIFLDIPARCRSIEAGKHPQSVRLRMHTLCFNTYFVIMLELYDIVALAC